MNFTPEAAAAMPGPDWLRSARGRATASLMESSLPTSDEEVWRYSRIDQLDLDSFHPASSQPVGDDPGSRVAEVVEAVGDRAGLITTWNGALVRSDLDDSLAAKGVVVVGADAWPDGERFGTVAESVDVFGALNVAFSPDPLLIDIPAGVVVEAPIVVVHWVTGDQTAAFPRVVVRAGEGSEATVCEYVTSSDVTALVVPVVELDLQKGSNLRYINVQELGDSVWQIGYQASRLQSDATLRSTSVALGGSYARVRTDSHLVGAGATSKLGAVYFGADSQMHDFRTLQGHEARKTTSDLLFKGAVAGTARSVYSGLIRVRKGAAGTNAFQTNRNLVLSDGAHADSVPNLEIEENDVRCSHASAVGPVDEEQRYYLESRGVPSDVAERLIVLGFLDETLATIPVDGLHALLRRSVATKLDKIESGAAT